MNQRLEALATYMAIVDPRAVNKLAYKWGYPLPSNDLESRLGMIYNGIMDEGDDFLKDMTALHPDKDLIMGLVDNSNHIEQNKLSLNADGAEMQPAVIKDDKITRTDLVRMTALIIIIFVLYKLIS